ncbi:MAG: CoA pyrophosphatase [Chlorobi bacterium]|nr:CoA pyrophosphatase [Chlorobiota bacterium]
MNDFATYLVTALLRELPGWTVQQRMMPRYSDGTVRRFAPPPDARRSAVAVIVTTGYDPAVLLTLRSSTLRYHRGQISFPGGRIEPGELPTDAALRELTEEVGIPASMVRVHGMLSSLYTPPSNSAILPIVMTCSARLDCQLDAREVEEAFWVELSHLDGSAVEEEWELPYGRMIVPHWRVHQRVPLWGATAIVLAELLALYRLWLNEQEPPSTPTADDLHSVVPRDQAVS